MPGIPTTVDSRITCQHTLNRTPLDKCQPIRGLKTSETPHPHLYYYKNPILTELGALWLFQYIGYAKKPSLQI